ncbi:hypothetical protein AQJ66_09145 [Streptomyces bungoensis]|uniref:Uncharacterized protein n=2 Tax=Streptomyces bungoensis TaxID=285568 RepID=A0A101T8T3_9ACTN|nr:hypothetical protein AQJ66_09145 [Streptomyces bungoensis]
MYAVQLSDFVDPSIKEEIIQAADEKFKGVLDRHFFESDDLDSSLLGYGLDYIRQYDDWQERWPMASDFMTYPDLESEDGEFEDSEEAFDVDPEYIDGEAYLIMSSLRIVNDA